MIRRSSRLRERVDPHRNIPDRGDHGISDNDNIDNHDETEDPDVRTITQSIEPIHPGTKKKKKEKQPGQPIWDELQREMELVEYGKNAVTGHARRKISKADSIVRTKKRKLLEQLEEQQQQQQAEMMIGGGVQEKEEQPPPKESSTIDKRRMRGSAAAASDDVLRESLMIFGNSKPSPPIQPPPSENEKDDSELNYGEKDMESSGDEEEDEEVDEDDNIDEGAYDDEVDEEDDDALQSDDDDDEFDEVKLGKQKPENPDTIRKQDRKQISKVSRGKGSASSNRRSSKKRMRLRRLKNFRSQKMAERHGDAIGAHARGKPNLAIRKLQQVAASAPSAPQIYSSLGMVYEDMLKESQRRSKVEIDSNEAQNNNATSSPLEHEEDIVRQQKKNSFASDVDSSVEDNDVSADETPEKILSHQLNLAKKAYGSYHVAALLCKRDYTLWLRAGDSAREIANLHTRAMEQQLCNDSEREAFNRFHRGEKLRWLEEAKNDYQSADNLHPPGIDIPAKLAHVMMELGMLSEALTILTDLKRNQHGGEFDASFRAWWLYADLMLRIGHECSQWNRGILTNSNYMFRRWLRKFSKSFDWKERRLQALSKAMEAACGSQSCAKLIGWLKSRSTAWMNKENNTQHDEAKPDRETERSKSDKNDKENSNEIDEIELSDRISHDELFEQEKEMLLEKNHSEIADFDKTTNEMNLEPDSIPMKERNEARFAMVNKQNDAFKTFVEEYRGEDTVKTLEDFVTETRDGHDLRLSASCHYVCEIASELLRHMLDMKLYDKGKFVAEAVSLYFKDRARLRDKSLQKKKELQIHQEKPIPILAMYHEKYDDAEGEDSDEDSTVVAVLSDDDDLVNSDESVISSMRNGVLPPELKCLYGLCLAGEGGKVYLATKCIEAVDDLPQETGSWLKKDYVDTDISTDSVWILFHETMTQPLGRTAAYALIADTLRSSGNEHDFCGSMMKLFRMYTDKMRHTWSAEAVFDTRQRKNLISRQRQNKIITILVACKRFEIDYAEKSLATGMKENGSVKPEYLLDVVESLSELLTVVWSVAPDGSISPTCTEVIVVMARALKLINEYAPLLQTCERASFLRKAIEKLSVILSLLCNCSALLDSNTNTDYHLEDLKQKPILSSWLSRDLKALSQRAYNVCVASNVTSFSGWEADEFSIRLIRGQKNNYFGISMDEGQVTGILPVNAEEEILSQWFRLQTLLPKGLSFDFDAMLSSHRKSPSYIEKRMRYENAMREHVICEYAEDAALTILLSFSRSCIALSQECQVQGNERLIFCALSILLPISQFCLNQSLWNAPIGQSAASSSDGVKNWSDFSSFHDDNELAPSRRPDYVRPCKRLRTNLPSGATLYARFDFENQPEFLSNLISMPIMTLHQGWLSFSVLSGRDHVKSPEQSPSPSELMRNIHCSVQRLRRCYTEHAIERASLNVSVSLLKLAESDACQNPFLCIQQAVLFASRAPKLGTSDQPFQARLPAPNLCTPKEALLILGRADCLRAVYFVQESAFLCSYVARICHSHRQIKSTWNIRWRIISILTYELSLMIRNMSGVQGAVEDTPGVWENSIIDELEDARIDGLIWKAQDIDQRTMKQNRVCVDISTKGLETVRAMEDLDAHFSFEPKNTTRFDCESNSSALVPV